MIQSKEFSHMVDEALAQAVKDTKGWNPVTHAILPFIRVFSRLLAVRVLEDFKNGIVATGPAGPTGDAVRSLVNQCIADKYTPLLWSIQLSDGSVVEARRVESYSGGVRLTRTPIPPSDKFSGSYSIEYWQKILSERFDSGEDFVLLRDFVYNTKID